MLTVLFFISVFSSLTWLVYTILYIVGQLGGNDLNALPPEKVALYGALVVLPIWVVWQVFALVAGYYRAKSADLRLTQLFNQMKKNQDYTDLVVRVMLDAEHEIKDGFVINKFDIFIADMNEILADIVQRCNAASSLQLEQLWARVKNGERWTIGKALVEAAKSHADFSVYVAEKARKDSVFKGTLLEFCSRYQNLHALLEKHDRDRVFITIIETGVMGKVYSILAPAVQALEYNPNENIAENVEENEAFAVSPRIANMQAPDAGEERHSLLHRLNPFKRKTPKPSFEPALGNDDDEEFFAALQKSMSTPSQTRQSYQSEEDADLPRLSGENEPRFVTNVDIQPMEDSFPRFDSGYGAEERLSGDVRFREENMPADFDASSDYASSDDASDDDEQNDRRIVFSRDSVETERDELRAFEVQEGEADDVFAAPRETEQAENMAEKDKGFSGSSEPKPEIKPEENFAYPFGGWINEDNYKK